MANESGVATVASDGTFHATTGQDEPTEPSALDEQTAGDVRVLSRAVGASAAQAPASPGATGRTAARPRDELIPSGGPLAKEPATIEVEVIGRGEVSEHTRRLAREKVAALERVVQGAGLRRSRRPDPGAEPPHCGSGSCRGRDQPARAGSCAPAPRHRLWTPQSKMWPSGCSAICGDT